MPKYVRVLVLRVEVDKEIEKGLPFFNRTDVAKKAVESIPGHRVLSTGDYNNVREARIATGMLEEEL
jgi:hypothetical protein